MVEMRPIVFEKSRAQNLWKKIIKKQYENNKVLHVRWKRKTLINSTKTIRFSAETEDLIKKSEK